MRYTLTAPVKDGIQYWEINDMLKGHNLVSISVDVPGAEKHARELFKVIKGSE